MKGKNQYPETWNVIRHLAYKRARYRCEHCGMTFVEGTTRATTAKNALGEPVRLTVHHLDGDRANNDWTNLLVCCQGCHLHVQARWRPGWPLPKEWTSVPQWIIDRDLPYERQLRLPGVS